jgi:hypothetical protein
MFLHAYFESFEKQYFKFVQVEGDGTFVPATEDEILQFENFLHDEKVDLTSIEDVGHVEELFSNDCMLMKKSDLEGDANNIIKFEHHFGESFPFG